MGRPINKKYFGNTNSPYDNEQTGGTSGLGGESVSTITVSNTGTTYSAGTVVTINAPQIAGGAQATISYSRTAAGNLSVTKVTGGTGYTSASLTVTTASAVTNVGTSTSGTYTLTNLVSVAGIYVGMLVDAPYAMQSTTYVTGISGNSVTLDKTQTATTASNVFTFTDKGTSFASSIALSTTTVNAIAFTSFLLAKDGGANAVAGGDIKKQEASRRYLVTNSEGTGQVKLATTATLAAGQMFIIATDVGGATYFVKKLTAHKATLVSDGNGSPIFADNAVAKQ